MGPSGARHHRVPGRRGGGARRRARPALPAPAAERQARRAASPATGGADPRGAGARGASVDRRRHARGGAAGAPARRGGRRAQEPVRRRGRDPGSGEDGGTPMSGIARKPLYTADDLAGFEDQRQLGRPGEYPFTRGIHPTMYRGRLWTMRQFAGFGSAQDTNQRYKFLLEHGQTGLSVAFDFPALKIIVDMFEWCAGHAPLWNTISISGYHIREAGATAAQELAFTLANGFTYVERGLARGLDVDAFAPRLSFFWDVHNDFFEEIAKLRAARRIWARHMRERYHAKNPRSWMMRFHCQTAGVTLTAQQPVNNVVRVAYQALAAVLGGTQSLHTNALDETLALPTQDAVRLALRTQQIIAHETGVAQVIDPLGGSYYLESLTDQLEREAEALFAEIQSVGCVVRGIEGGWFQRQIARSAEGFQRQVEAGGHVIVGVNAFTSADDHPVEILKVSNDAEQSQRRRLAGLRAERDTARARESLDALTRAAEQDRNVIGPMLDCARAYCTLYEIRHALERVYGAYRAPVFF